MGYYIETPEPLHKALQLVLATDAETITKPTWPPPKDKALVCVVENGIFDAAAICFSAHEFEAFNWPSDRRPKTWLIMDKSKAIELCPAVSKFLK